MENNVGSESIQVAEEVHACCEPTVEEEIVREGIQVAEEVVITNGILESH